MKGLALCEARAQFVQLFGLELATVGNDALLQGRIILIDAGILDPLNCFVITMIQLGLTYS